MTDENQKREHEIVLNNSLRIINDGLEQMGKDPLHIPDTFTHASLRTLDEELFKIQVGSLPEFRHEDAYDEAKYRIKKLRKF